MRISFFFLSFIFVLFSETQAQNDTISKPKRPAYWQISTGAGMLRLRDFAVSPLFYEGVAARTDFEFIRKDQAVERSFYSSTNIGSLVNKYNKTGISLFIGLDLGYLRLYQIKRLSNLNWNTKIGGNLITTTNIRLNPSFGNNSLAFENISNLMFSAKVTRDVSRKKAKEVEILFFKKQLQPQKRELSYLLDLGLLNMNFRPGYAYSYLPAVEKNDGLINIFSNHQMSVFNGYRLKARLDYTRYLPNGNATQISYVFDAYQATGKYEPLQYAQHSLRFSILFNHK